MKELFSVPGSPASKKRFPDLLFALLLLLFSLLTTFASWQESATIDEFRHLSTGVHYWQSKDFSFDNETPPLWKMAMALPAYLAGAKPVRFNPVPDMFKGSEPWFVATDFMRDNATNYTAYLQSARMVNVLAACICLVCLYWRLRQRFGAEAALYGATFLALSPTFLAHSHYATTDIIATATLLATVFLLLDYYRSHDWQWLAAATIIFAISLLSKFSALLLLPLLAGVPLLVAWQQAGAAEGGAVSGSARSGLALLHYGRVLLLMLLSTLLLINLMYGFNGFGVRLAEMTPESRSLAALAQTAAGSLPLPLPRAFVGGVDRQKADSDYAEFPSFFMGNWSIDGFRSYYLGAFALKETVPFILLLLAAVSCRPCRKEFVLGRMELLLLCYLPVMLFMVLSFMNRLNVGIRYMLPAYPFFCYFIGRLYADRSVQTAWRLVLTGLIVLHFISVARVAPNYTSYFNELCGGPEKGYRYLLDSNLDWGQDLLRLKDYMARHNIDKVQLAYFGHGLPEFYGVNYEPLTAMPHSGYVAISASLLQGHPYLLTYPSPPVVAESGEYRFLQSLTPVGRAGYSLLLYRID